MNFVKQGGSKINLFRPLVLITLFTLFLGAHCRVFAMTPSLHFRHLNSEQGLAQNSVWAMLQDKRGFVWLGTSAGLNRYDGYIVRTFLPDSEDDSAISGKAIAALLQGNNGYIWIGTREAGLNRYDPKTESFKHYQSNPSQAGSLANNDVRALAQDQLGILWVGTTNGLYRLDPASERFTRFNIQGGSNSITQILVNSDQTLVVATGKGVKLFDTNKQQYIDYGPEFDGLKALQGFSVYALYQDQNSGELWVGTRFKGLFQLNNRFNLIQHYQWQASDENSLSNNFVTAIAQDHEGFLWITTTNGLNKLDPTSQQFSRYYHNPSDFMSINNNYLRSILLDSFNNLWAGSVNSGANILALDSQKFEHYRTSNQANNCMSDDINVVFVDNDTLWLGTGVGIYRYNRQTQTCEHYQNSAKATVQIAGNIVHKIVKTSNGDLWFGTLTGLSQLKAQDQTWVNYKHDKSDSTSLAEDFVYDLFVDSKDRLWVGTVYGLDLYESKTQGFKHYKIDNSKLPVKNNFKALAISEGKNDNLWLGSMYGFFRFNISDGQFSRYEHTQDKQPSNGLKMVSSIHRDKPNSYWLATRQGLKHFDAQTEQFTHYGIKAGLPSEFIRAISDDQQGQIWLSSNKGLSRLTVATGEVVNYDTSDGLQGLEFSDSAFFDQRRGEMLFAGSNGFNLFRAKALADNAEQAATIVFTDYLVDNVSLATQDQNPESPLTHAITETSAITLAHDKASFALTFSNLQFATPQKQRYQYKMVGLDQNWINTDAKNRRATYTNLASGDYVFQVRENAHDAPLTELKIKVLKSPWQTWPAYLAYSVVMALAIYLMIVYRTKSLQRTADKLSKSVAKRTQQLQSSKIQLEQKNSKISQLLQQKRLLFANVSHEFRTPLTLILSPIQQMKGSAHYPAEDQAKLNLIERSGHRLLRMVDQLLDLAKLDNKEVGARQPYSLHESLHFVQASFMSVAQNRHIDFTVQPFDDVLLNLLPDSLDKILINLLSNAFKYTPEGGKVWVEVTTEQQNSNHSAVIAINDTGIGIAQQYLSSIFERFIRIDNPQEQRMPGSGIGLALVKELIEANNGSIKVDSQLGQGSQFIVTLPIHSHGCASDQVAATTAYNWANHLEYEVETLVCQPATATMDLPQSTDENGQSILIIEDNLDMREFLISMFAAHFHCLAAPSGELGQSMAIEHIPDLIICDVMMPGISGYEVASKLKQDQRSCHIPIILLTAKGDLDSRMQGWQQNVDDYIAKPFHQAELMLRVTNLLSIRAILKKRFGSELSSSSPLAMLKQSDVCSKDQALLERFEQIVAEHYGEEDFNRAQAASLMALSERQLNRKLAALVDHNFSEYLRKYRLRQAIGLLGSGLQVAQIGDRVGFSSTTYFSSCFKAEYNMTVKQYEKTMKAKLEQQIDTIKRDTIKLDAIE